MSRCGTGKPGDRPRRLLLGAIFDVTNPMKVDNVGPKRIPTVERAFGEAKQVTVERAPRRSEAGGEVWEAHRAQRVEAV